VISGHFHKHQSNENLTYVGTPFSHSFGESNQTKVIGIYNIEEGRLELEQTTYRKHLTIEIDCDKQQEETTTILNTDGVLHKYRVILTGKQENIDKFPRELFDKDGLDIKWITRPTDFVTNDVTIQ